MVRIVSPADVKPRLVEGTRVTDLFGAARSLDSGPQSFFVESPLGTPGSAANAHFHVVDQFQVFVGGNGTLGKHPIRPVAVHYADAYTTYGPFVQGERNFEWITARVCADPGGRTMPGSHAELKHSRGRYLVEHVTDLPEEIIESDRISVIDPHADGLAAEVLVVRPGETVAGPDPSRTSGQHYVVLAGDVVANGRLYAWLSNAYVAPDEPLPNFTAGDQGLALLALSFPAKTTF